MPPRTITTRAGPASPTSTRSGSSSPVPCTPGTFGPPDLDATFGPEVRFQSVPKDIKPNRPPASGSQFFGQVQVAGKSGVMTVSLHDQDGKSLHSMELPPEPV